MLALVGSGEYLPAMEPVDRELLRRLSGPPRVVCLPTAAGQEGAARIAYWSQLGVDHFTRLGAQVEALPVIDRASAHDADLALAIEGANFVYLSGGKPGYLYQTLAGSPAWEAIRSVLAQGGVLAGCSAGAMILGEKIVGFPFLKSGFNFLPGSLIMPHYDEISRNLRTVIRWLAGPTLTVVGIEGNTALVVNEAQAEVLGTGGVTMWNHAGPTRYQPGLLPVSLALKGSKAAAAPLTLSR
jgi:cyanophycinase